MMRVCMDHWEQLRKAINDRGLGEFVSHSGQEAAERTANLANGSTDPKDFDPLIAANMAIISYYIAQTDAQEIPSDDSVCPICNANENSDGPDLAENWINGAADDIFAVAKSKGLVIAQ